MQSNYTLDKSQGARRILSGYSCHQIVVISFNNVSNIANLECVGVGGELTGTNVDVGVDVGIGVEEEVIGLLLNFPWSGS